MTIVGEFLFAVHSESFSDVGITPQIQKINQLDVEILLAAVFALQEEAVGDQLHDRFVALVEVGCGVGFELLDHRFDFLRRDAVGGVLLGELFPFWK